MSLGFSLVAAAVAVAVTALVLIVAVVAAPPLAVPQLTPPRDDRPRLQLLSRVLFAHRQPDAITLDCLVVSAGHPTRDLAVPPGLPFTLKLHPPDCAWFADRVEQLLEQWAAENRELVLEFLQERPGHIHTTIASGASRVHLELAGAAGLPGPAPPS